MQLIGTVTIDPAQSYKKHEQENCRVEIMKGKPQKIRIGQYRTVMDQIKVHYFRYPFPALICHYSIFSTRPIASNWASSVPSPMPSAGATPLK
jgi:hypothetical protein